MEFIEELVGGAQAPTLMVRISAKFVEINQNDLQALTVNTVVNFFDFKDPGFTNISTTGAPLDANGVPLRLPSAATRLPGANGFSPDSIDTLISPQGIGNNVLAGAGDTWALSSSTPFSRLSPKRSPSMN